MNRLFRTGLCLSLLVAATHAAVVRPAPDFHVEGVRKGTSLRAFRGQTVVLLIARSNREKLLRAQLARLHDIYVQFANEKVIFAAAILRGPAEVRSDIPFVLASDPAQVAADYGINSPFAIAVIGQDGNLDLVTTKVVAAGRVKDMIFNNYESQAAARKQPVVTQ